jgi:hypothetical protein
MEGNYQKYVVREAGKGHKLYKKFLHIFCNGWAYYRLIFKLAHSKDGYYHHQDIDFRLPILVRYHHEIDRLMRHKACGIELITYEIEILKKAYLDFKQWLELQEAKLKPKIYLEDVPVLDSLLMNLRLGLFK